MKPFHPCMSLTLIGTILVGASALRAQETRTSPAPACFPQRYAELRQMPEASRTAEQQREFEQLQRACAEAGAAAVMREEADSAAPGQRAAPAPEATRAPSGAAGVPRPPAVPERLRHGFWFTGGLGYGTLGCQDCTDRSNGVAVAIGLGGTVSQHVQLGGGIHGWSKTENDVTLTASTVTAVIRVFPSARGRFFFLGGLGAGSVSAHLSSWSATSETAGAAVLGIGYDIRLSRVVSLTPFWNGVAMAGQDWDVNFGQLGLAITTY